ncbi:MAG: hypothetical protein GF329_13605, partial [Candidatus Lokiarchaeota archaeon]|nr:hypothetical protein [Candidatus Lokiarchaeota archaeon]
MNVKKSISFSIIFLILLSSMISLLDINMFNTTSLENPNTDIENSALSWLSHTQISNAGGDDARYPDVAVDNIGNIHIVWVDDSDEFDSDYNFDIYYRRWDATLGAFTQIKWISSISTSDTYDPAITTDNNGNVHVVWRDYTNYNGSGYDYDIFYRMWNKSTETWQGHYGTYDVVSIGQSSSGSYPDIAADMNGNIHVVWQYNYDIYYNYWNSTTGLWGSSTLISNESTGNSYYPHIATDYLNNLHVVWQDDTYSTYDDVFYKTKNATTGLWSVNEIISIDCSSYTYYPSIAVDGLGNVHIVWYDQTNVNGAGTDYDILYRMFNITSGIWSGHMNSTDVISDRGGSYSSTHPDIGADNLGNVYVVWSEYDYYSSSSDYDMLYRMYNITANSWEPMELIYGNSYDNSERASITVDLDGNSHVVWQEYDYDYEIFFSKSVASPPMTPILSPITPNPNPNLDNQLIWTRPMEPAQFYIYRNSSYITSVENLTPIAKVSTNSYADVVTENGTYYYVIKTENEVGNSSLSNCEGVNVSSIPGYHRLRISQNADFAKYGFAGNGSESDPWLIKNWYINGSGANGIHISDTTDYFIAQNNTIYDGNIGIYLNNVTNGVLINNTARFNEIGINITNSIGNILINNTVHNTTNPSGTAVGIGLTNSDNNWFADNDVYGTDGGAVYGGVGFWLFGSESNTLFNNHIHHNLGVGVIFSQNSHFNNLTENEINDNTGIGTISYHDTGIAFENSGGRDNYLIKNDIYGHTITGISSSHTGIPNFFYNNTIHDNSAGMDMVVSNAAGWEFNYNKFYNNDQAGDLWLGSASFYKNEIWNNTNGLYFWGAGGTTLSNNTAWNNTGYGISASADDMELYNNVAYENGNGIYCSDTRIIADGNKAYNNSNMGFGVYRDTQFTNNIAIGNGIGIYMNGWGHQTVDSNTILGNGIGIHCNTDENATITNNDILNNSQYGIYCENSNHTVITWNTILNGTVGIYLQNNLNSTVQYNEIYNFSQVGIKIEETNESLISWNLLFNNSVPLEEINCVNNTIGINPSEQGPTLDPISPPDVDDGAVHLRWQNLTWATYYQVFRSWVFTIDEFWDIIWRTPVLNVTTNDIWDIGFTNTGSYYYVVVAANSTTWSTISNSEWANITGLYGIPGTPILNFITPNPDYNGIIELDWSNVENATEYYIYRDISTITDITGMTPIAMVSDSNYTDTVSIDDDYYYVIIGANEEHNGSISNCENVTVIISPTLETPTLYPLIPKTDYDGFINLNWTDADNATHYYVYRDINPILNLTNREPIAMTLHSNYTDVNFIDGVFYYAVTSANLGWNSSLSNSENVTISKQYPVGDTFLDSISPSTDSDGIIDLSWTIAENASWYYIYKDTSFISSLDSLTPIVSTTDTNYTDYNYINGTFYYAVIGANFLYNGTKTNSESVTVAIPPRKTTGWTIPTILSSQESSADSKNSSTSPNMIMDKDGNIFVVWADSHPLLGSGNDIDIFLRIWDESTKNWGNIKTVSTESNSDSTNPEVALDSSGNLYVVWVDLSNWNGAGSDADIFCKIYNTSTKTWNQTMVVTTQSLNDSTGASIAVDDLGNIYIAWQENNGSQTNIYERFWNSTSFSWSTNATVSSEVLGDSQNPKIEVDANYNIHIVWAAASSSLLSGSDTDIFYRMWNETGQYWSGTEPVCLNSNDNSSSPSITLEQDGTIHVIWHDLTPLYGSGNDYDIFYRNRDISDGSWSGFENSTDIISYESDGSSLFPSIMIDEYSVIHVVWVDDSNISGAGTDADIFYKFWNDSGSTWEWLINSTDIITSESSGDSYYASVATNRYQQGTIATKVHVVWQDKTNFGFGSDWDIYYKSYIEIAVFPLTPILSPINPNIDYDGIIYLDWTISGNATKYFVYRDISNITDVSFLTPIASLTNQTNYTDTLSVDGTYYYVIVSGNEYFNSSISNCENVTLIKYYPVSAPILDSIIPSLDYDGFISLNWSTADNATIYYIYRDTSPITDYNALSPIATTSNIFYEDTLSINGTYYYVLVAGNLGYNSTISNCQNVTAEIYYPIEKPILDEIVPQFDYDGIIHLNWNDDENASFYYIYRDTTLINNLSGLTMNATIFQSNQSNYIDTITTNDTYFYVIMGSNKAWNSSISDCENVTVEIYPLPGTPFLNQISPSTNYYGNVKLNWTDTANTTYYFIYRSTSSIINISELTPIASIWDSNYTDYIFINGTYFYTIVASNIRRNGSISNVQNVTIEMYYPISTPLLNPIIPSIDYDGIIELDWNDCTNATKYYVYRDSSLIDVVFQSNFIDNIFIDGNYTYTIIAGNQGYNSSVSDPENVTIIKYWPVGIFSLAPIVPEIDYDGSLNLNWSAAENASMYYIYRDTEFISNTSSLTPIANVSQTNYTDTVLIDGIYYYLILSSNLAYNMPSNCENITVFIQYPINTPILNPISPSIDKDGIINLNWPSESNALWYYVYKHNSPINSSNIASLEPITKIANVNHIDVNHINGTMYYCIIGGNWLYNSSISNLESVKIVIPIKLNDWGALEVLSSFSIADSTVPKIVSDSLGNLHVVFEDTMSPDREIIYIYWDAQTNSWMNYEIISSQGVGNSTSQEVYVDQFDNIHIIWLDTSNISDSGNDSDIFYKYLNTTTGIWSQIFVLTSESSQNSLSPTIDGDNKGNLYIAWQEFDGNQNVIFFKKFDAALDTWTSNTTIS